MKLFLHVCCAPCTTYTLAALRNSGVDVTGFFFNPNIHPYREFRKRLTTFELYSSEVKLPVIINYNYGFTEYIRKVVFNEKSRCTICYEMRLQETARKAVKLGADTFSTTLLYSRHQNHKTIAKIGKNIATKHGIDFYYEDFREGWQEGIDQAIAMGLYRQPYCGCIYSEQERYDKRLQKQMRKTTTKK